MGEAAAGERLAPDRRGDARPRLSSGGRQGGSDPRANGGLLAHLVEEQENPLGFFLAGKAEEAVAYESPSGD